MAFNQFTTLENFIWHNEIPSDQISEAVDRMMTLTFPEEVRYQRLNVIQG